jgi:hypothetical protein
VRKLPFRPGAAARRRSSGRPVAAAPQAASAMAPAASEAAPAMAPAAPGESPAITVIGSLRPQSHVAVQGMVRSVGTVLVAGGTAYHFTLVDGSGELDVLFTEPGDAGGLQPSTRIIAAGRVGSYDSKLAL